MRGLVAAAALLAATAAIAVASGARAGALYFGHSKQGARPVYLHVSSTGRSVRFDVPFPPLFCQGGGALERQITHRATISSRGTFSGSILYEYKLNHRKTARLYFSGRFSGGTVRGTVRSEYFRAHQCDGSTGYSAKPR